MEWDVQENSVFFPRWGRKTSGSHITEKNTSQNT